MKTAAILPKLTLLIFLFTAFSAVSLHAQERGNVSGVVTDSANGEALAFSSVYIAELKRGVYTDSRGIFLFTGVPEDKKLTLIVSYVGYNPKKVTFEIAYRVMTKLKIALSERTVNIKEVEIEGTRFNKENETDISLQRISSRQLEALPQSVETDVLRSLQYIPGVQFSGDASAKYYVRGGTSNQNLILLDDTPVYNPYHALGVFSAIDPEMINSIEFHKSAYPAEFSGRLSSVLKIVTKDGNKMKMGGKASLSLLSVKGLLEGPIPYGSYMLTARKSTSTNILKKFINNKNYPYDFYDWSFKLNYANPHVLEDAKFTVHGFFSGDKLMNNNPVKQDFKWTNDIIGFEYFQLSKNPLFYVISGNFSRFTGEVFPNATPTKASRNNMNDIIVKADFRYIYESKDELDFGLRIQEIKTSLLVTNPNGFKTDLGSRGTEISVFARYLLLRLGAFGADVGTRVNLTRMAGGESGFFEPRLRFTYRSSPQVAIKWAWGLFKQDLTTISDENEAVTLYEPWIIVPRYLHPSKSVHYVIGIETEFIKDYIFNIDGYYKTCRDIALLNDNKNSANNDDLISGSSLAYGLEFQFITNQNDFSLNAAYTLAWVTNEIKGQKEYAPRYDSRHNINFTLDYNLGDGWKASAAWVYTSGHPFTQVRGYYDKLTLDGINSENLFLQDYIPLILLGDRNIARLPDYHRLDLSLSKQLNLPFCKLHINLSLVNVYNRKNIFYFDRKTGEQVNMIPFLPTASLKLEL